MKHLNRINYGGISQYLRGVSSSSREHTAPAWDGSKTMSGYEQALRNLDKLIHVKTADDDSWEKAFNNTAQYLNILGLEDQIDKSNVIHVAGTKGKGSTSAFTESILRHCGYKTGLFTSPHLCDVTERFRINGFPIQKEEFSEQLFDVYNKLENNTSGNLGMPGYFRFLTILGLKIFIENNLDVVVLEVGMGGRLDATNIIKKPIVCGISRIGFDHMEFLGNSLGEIAMEKAGIMKAGIPCYTIQQEAEASAALTKHSNNIGVDLKQADNILQHYKTENGVGEMELGISGEHQFVNASLAVKLAYEYEQRMQAQMYEAERHKRLQLLNQHILPKEYQHALKKTSWPGRCQEIVLNKEDFKYLEVYPINPQNQKTIKFFLDGAHTEESILAAGSWFQQSQNLPDSNNQYQKNLEENSQRVQKVLLFYCQPQRDPYNLLNTINSLGINFDICVFTLTDSSRFKVTSDLQRSSDDKSMQHLDRIGTAWKQIKQDNMQCQNFQYPCLRESLKFLLSQHSSNQYAQMHVFAVGSLYLVGDILKLLNRQPANVG